jgi:hypothetical protein
MSLKRIHFLLLKGKSEPHWPISSRREFFIMSAPSFAAAISVESDQIPNPTPVHSAERTRCASPREADRPEDLEMYPMPTAECPSPLANNGQAKTSLRNEADPHSSTPPPGRASDLVQTIWNPYKNRFRLLASCMTVFANGMNDSAPGPLIASIERYRSPVPLPAKRLICPHFRDYNIAYGTVSTIFVCNALGFSPSNSAP